MPYWYWCRYDTRKQLKLPHFVTIPIFLSLLEQEKLPVWIGEQQVCLIRFNSRNEAMAAYYKAAKLPVPTDGPPLSREEKKKINRKEWYAKNKDKLIAYRKAWKEKHPNKQGHKIWLDDIKAKTGCYFCKENTPCALAYHHLSPANKVDSISKMVKVRDREKMILEMAKCVLVCHNCHSKIHAGLLKIKDSNAS